MFFSCLLNNMPVAGSLMSWIHTELIPFKKGMDGDRTFSLHLHYKYWSSLPVVLYFALSDPLLIRFTCCLHLLLLISFLSPVFCFRSRTFLICLCCHLSPFLSISVSPVPCVCLCYSISWLCHHPAVSHCFLLHFFFIPLLFIVQC